MSPTAIRVAMLMALRADYRGRSAIPLRDIASAVGRSKTAVDRAIAQLVERGFIHIVDRNAKPCVYRILTVADGDVFAEDVPDDDPVDIKTVNDVPKAHADHVATAPIQKVLHDLTPDAIQRIRRHGPGPVDVYPPRSQPVISEAETTQWHVDHLLSLAGVEPDPQEPFYWRRAAHRDALTEILKDRTWEEICDEVSAAADKPQAKTIKAIVG